MAVSKVVYGASVLVDLTGDTVREDALLLGITAHGPDGRVITGTLRSFPIEKYVEDYNVGYVDNGTWKYEKPTRTYTDIYRAKAGHSYFITLGGTVGSRFRAMFTTEDVTLITWNTMVQGDMIKNVNNPAAYANASYETMEDGYIIVAKDNVGVRGIGSYVYDRSAWA